MKKQTKIVILLLIIFGIGYFINNYLYKKHKFECKIDNDCIMSYKDPEDFQICVNKNYYNNYINNLHYDCKIDKNLTCFCQNNKCVRNDKKIGCK